MGINCIDKATYYSIKMEYPKNIHSIAKVKLIMLEIMVIFRI